MIFQFAMLVITRGYVPFHAHICVHLELLAWGLFTIKVHTARMNTRRQLLDRQATSDNLERPSKPFFQTGSIEEMVGWIHTSTIFHTSMHSILGMTIRSAFVFQLYRDLHFLFLGKPGYRPFCRNRLPRLFGSRRG